MDSPQAAYHAWQSWSRLSACRSASSTVMLLFCTVKSGTWERKLALAPGKLTKEIPSCLQKSSLIHSKLSLRATLPFSKLLTMSIASGWTQPAKPKANFPQPTSLLDSSLEYRKIEHYLPQMNNCLIRIEPALTRVETTLNIKLPSVAGNLVLVPPLPLPLKK